MGLKSAGSAETDITIAAGIITSAQYRPVIPVPGTFGAGHSIVVLRALISWNNLAGGDGTSRVTCRLQGGQTITELQKDLNDYMAKLSAVDGGTSVDVATGNQSDGSLFVWFCMPASAAAGGDLLPFATLNQLRISNPGQAYTGGDVVIEEIVPYIDN